MNPTKINWTDKVWNPVTGCTKVSAGCKNCYAETIAKRFWKDRKFTDVQLHPERLDQPLRMKKSQKIFVNSMSDLFHNKLPDSFIDIVFDIMRTVQWHTFQVLTKRPERMLDYLEKSAKYVTDNVWLGVSVEDQKTADERIPLLLQTPAKVMWLSIEPLLSETNINGWLSGYAYKLYKTNINWVVIGCESGPQRRECKIEWIENIVEQCKEASVPVWIKQMQINGKVIDAINQFPKHLQIRKFPKV